MENEDVFIPFRSTDLTGKRVLTLAPHPDDETIGCGGALALHVDAGDPVKVVFMTNGARGDVSGKADREAYIRLRRTEARAACARLGVSDLAFWPREDRTLADAREAVDWLRDLLDSFRPDLVYAPSPLEIHPDHRAGAAIVQEAARACDLRFDVALCEVSHPLFVNTLVDITPVLDRKKAAMRAYASQLKELPYDEVCLGLSRFRSLTLPGAATHAEGFNLVDAETIRDVGVFAAPFRRVGRLPPHPAEADAIASVIKRGFPAPAGREKTSGSIARAMARLERRCNALLEKNRAQRKTIDEYEALFLKISRHPGFKFYRKLKKALGN
ncbi:MAG: PIG-L family deacetylase [Desulfobacterales bacterium]|nr:PIG-L family deacetylase [Desulfobacterales bacterium]